MRRVPDRSWARPRRVARPYGLGMELRLELAPVEFKALQEQALAEGISVEEAAHRAIVEYLERSRHDTTVSAASRRVRESHADALRRLGEV